MLTPTMRDLRRIGLMDAEDLACEIQDNRKCDYGHAASALRALKRALFILSRDRSKEALAMLAKRHGNV